MISGILHRLREGCRWARAAGRIRAVHGGFNRYNRWSKRGLWQDVFAALAGWGEQPEVTVIDSTAVRAPRAASGAKGGNVAKPSAARAAAALPNSMP